MEIGYGEGKGKNFTQGNIYYNFVILGTLSRDLSGCQGGQTGGQ